MKGNKELLHWLREQIEAGRSVVFDFKTLTIKVNNVKVCDKMLYMPNLYKFFDKFQEFEVELNAAYKIYKHSIPSANEPSRPYFKALKYDELSEDDKTNGISRAMARMELEYFVYQLADAGRIKIFFGNGYFWRSKQDPDFVIMKSWFNL